MPSGCRLVDNQLVIDGEAFLILGGEAHNSSVSQEADIGKIMTQAADLGLNTVLLPVAWEDFEPNESAYCYTLIASILKHARANLLRVVILWFGAYKNASSSYAPAWVKLDPHRFPRVVNHHGVATQTLSPFSKAVRDADARAFSALMRYLHINDLDHTVIMVQVENEAGVLHTSRDHSQDANQRYVEAVPANLIAHVQERAQRNLVDEITRNWIDSGERVSGHWGQVFGASADELFMAWHLASYIDHLAVQGRGEHDVPLFVNAWIQAGPGYLPGEYPSGGPIAKVLDVWRLAAPSIDLFAPDIYEQHFKSICHEYHRADNPLFIPEAKCDEYAASRCLYALGQYAAIGFSPFGFEDLASQDNFLPAAYKTINSMMPLVLRAQASDKIGAVLHLAVEDTDSTKVGNIRFHSSTNNAIPMGAALIVAVGEYEFYVVGRGLRLGFDSDIDPQANLAVLDLHEGEFVDREWIPTRRLNGDESEHGTQLVFDDSISLVKLTLYAYSSAKNTK